MKYDLAEVNWLHLAGVVKKSSHAWICMLKMAMKYSKIDELLNGSLHKK